MAYHAHLNRNAPDYQLVMAEVDRVLRENYVIEPPVEPIKIAENYGISVHFMDFDGQKNNLSGFFSWRHKAIVVNEDDNPKRQNFTIAHELGHYVLHRELFENHPEEYQVLMRRPLGASEDPLEKEANSFAANLLVPKTMLRKYMNFASVEELSNLFNVSADVIGYRSAYESKYAAA